MAARAKKDPELLRQLDDAHSGKSLIEAVVRVKPDDASQIVPSPERTEELTKTVLKRVEKQIGKSAARYNVFKNLGSFAVSADPDFLRELMSQPEVAAVVANRQPQGALIEPVKKTPARTETQKPSKSARKSKTRSAHAAHKSAK
ncbi:MAG: hypothetical protein M3R69_09740 [Acidobacteriota bacterium]|nr:hypothetical protein [Acidobacteriota bacterium]